MTEPEASTARTTTAAGTAVDSALENAQGSVPDGEWYLNHRQPPIHVRLKEASNFLADEDYTQFLEFEARLRELEPYLQWCTTQELSNEERSLLLKVKGMLKVQKEWIRRDNEFEPINFDFPIFLPFSARLRSQAKIWRDYSAVTEATKEFERPDHPPFTLIRDQNTRAFLQSMKAELSDPSSDFSSKDSLIGIEAQNYLDTYENLSVIGKELMRQESDQAGKARQRGTHRRTIEMALNLLANSQEPYCDNGRLRVIKIEQPEAQWIPEVRLCIAADPEKRPEHSDIYWFTMNILFMQKVELDRAEKFRQGEIARYRRDPTYIGAPTNYRGPWVPISKAKATQIYQMKVKYLLGVVKELEKSVERAPRPLLRQLILQIYHGISGKQADQSAELQALVQENPGANDNDLSHQGITAEEIKVLVLLTGPSKNTRKGTPWYDKYLDRRREEIYSAPDIGEVSRGERIDVDLKMLSDYLEIILSPYNVPENTLGSVPEVIHAVNLLHAERRPKNPPFLVANIEDMLEALHRANIIFYIPEAFEGQGGIRRPWPDHHPEDDMDWYNGSMNKFQNSRATRQVEDKAHAPILRKAYLTHLGFQLGQTVRLLVNACEDGPKVVPANAVTGTQDTNYGEDRGSSDGVKRLMENSIKLDYEDSQFTRNPHLKTPTMIIGRPVTLDRLSGEGSPFDNEQAARHQLHLEMILENVWTIESFSPDYVAMWSFATIRIWREGKMRIYFSVNRWPLVMQSPERQAVIKGYAPIEEVPARALGKRKRQSDPQNDEEWWKEQGMDFFKDTPRERQIDGPTYFPFGGTPFQQELLSRQLENDLRDVPEFREQPPASSRWGRWVNDMKSLWPNKKRRTKDDLFGLPKIPETWRKPEPSPVSTSVSTTR